MCNLGCDIKSINMLHEFYTFSHHPKANGLINDEIALQRYSWGIRTTSSRAQQPSEIEWQLRKPLFFTELWVIVNTDYFQSTCTETSLRWTNVDCNNEERDKVPWSDLEKILPFYGFHKSSSEVGLVVVIRACSLAVVMRSYTE